MRTAQQRVNGDRTLVRSIAVRGCICLKVLAQSQSQLDANQQHYIESQTENEQVSKQLEHRIKVTQEQLTSQIQSLEQQLHQQPEDKLYTRAQKLVELGADIAEIMRECDIPRAEAEMLLAVHRQKSAE